MFTERDVDDYLSVSRYMSLNLQLGIFTVNLQPYKACFTVTVYDTRKYEYVIYQNFYNTWNEAFKSYTEQCNKYLKINTDKITKQCAAEQERKKQPLTEIKIRK